jgi:menaquinone-dependent protoporphyrinogen oxidase
VARIAILYDSTAGQTAKIARKIAEIATAAAHSVELRDIHSLPPEFRLEDFQAIILGAGIHMGKHSRQMIEFVDQNRLRLEAIPSAFLSVSLSAAGKTEEQRQHARDCLDQFLRQTHWQPWTTAIIAGALLYRTYGFWLRLMMKWIAWREGGDTDTSKDYEYTDWNQVRQFTEEFLRQSLGAGIAEQHASKFPTGAC